MGGGGLRILPHKSWNVYGFRNRERVRQDEEKAQRDEEERQGRTRKADQELRLELLRKRAKRGEGAEHVEEEIEQQHQRQEATDAAPQAQRDSVEDVELVKARPNWREVEGGRKQQGSRHIDFFSDLEREFKAKEQAMTKKKKKKEELEAWQKKVGALTYLGQTVLDAKGKQPWYSQGQAQRQTQDIVHHQQKLQQRDFDPLNTMKGHLKTMEKRKQQHHAQQEVRVQRFAPAALPSCSSSSSLPRTPLLPLPTEQSSEQRARVSSEGEGDSSGSDSSSDERSGDDDRGRARRRGKHRKHRAAGREDEEGRKRTKRGKGSSTHRKRKKAKKTKEKHKRSSSGHRSSGDRERRGMGAMKMRQLVRQQDERDRVAKLLAVATAGQTPELTNGHRHRGTAGTHSRRHRDSSSRR